jgi:transposase InsO family protein
MDSRLCFVASCLRSEAPISSLCARHGISRKTGYKWLARYEALGAAGLQDRSSAPRSSVSWLSASVSDPILALRRARPSWGPHKLLARLSMDHPDRVWPAASTVGDLLAREGLVTPRQHRARAAGRSPIVLEPLHSNDSWSADFKGWFRTGDGVRCEPLTVTDNFSRYLLVSHAVPRPTFAEIKPLFIGAFREHGLPLSLRTDNGSPFASNRGLAGLTQFSVWLLKLNIWPDRIAPGRPDQNGRHERMHRTLNQDSATPRSADLASQQLRMDVWRADFNTQRPHEALGQRCPASIYQPSARPYSEVLSGWDYPSDHHKRRVNKDGYIKWQDQRLYLSEALRGEDVALSRRDDGEWMIRFRSFDLAVLEDDSGNLRCSRLARSGRAGTA